MTCPICGRNLLIEVIENPTKMAIYCEEGHFCTGYYKQPSLAVNEVISAHEWKAVREEEDE